MAKDRKGKKGGAESAHQEEEEVNFVVEGMACAVKKMGKGKKVAGSGTSVVRGENNNDRDQVSKKKSTALGFSSCDALDEEDGIGEVSAAFKKSSAMPSFALLEDCDKDDQEKEDDELAFLDKEDLYVLEEDDEVSLVNFSGKSSNKKITKRLVVVNDDARIDDDPKVSELTKETSKNKKKKSKKKSGRTEQEEDDLDKILAELGEAAPVSNAVPLSAPKEIQKAQTLRVSSDETLKDEIDEGVVESTAAKKKKKKKKQKEKEKKVAAEVEGKTENHAGAVEAKAENKKRAEEAGESASAKKQKKVKEKENREAAPKGNKKVPKTVREIQEAVARRKEDDERKRKEEEERVRKAEEERVRQEEIERQAEEARRRKKEREKEKLLKKRLEGKPLTSKQKDEARRLEAMRNQFLASAGGLPLPDGENNTSNPKRSVYKPKTFKHRSARVNGVPSVKPTEESAFEGNQGGDEGDAESVERAILNKRDLTSIMENSEISDSKQQEVREEANDEWDAVELKLTNLGAFSDEEVDSTFANEVAKDFNKDTMSMKAPNAGCICPEVKSVINKFQDAENTKSHTDENEIDISKKNDASGKEVEAELRSPICCIMGHVDTGKTKLLDCIRGTNVQEGEAGGITQQIGATYFPAENIRERTKELKANATLKIPGLLVIDTPGHESFSNLRSRGSGLCDIAVLVVDIMHGLKPQTIESLNLLKMRNTEFIVALNKIDRLYNWKTCNNAPIVTALEQQTKDVQHDFERRLKDIIAKFMEQGINTQLYYKNKEMGKTFSIVPTSAISGEGIPDLLLLLVLWAQRTMVEKLTFSNKVKCTVLEVKVVEGLGTTIDVVLVNGVLHEGDQIVLCGMQGPIVTTIRALLTPHPMKELRVNGTYLHHKEIKAAQGIKITAQGLEHAIVGTGIYVLGPYDDVEDVKEEVMEDMKSVITRIDTKGEGVCVQASTLGSLEALLEYLKTLKEAIPVLGISIGPVHKKDVMKASVMLEKKKKEYAVILAFDVKVTPEARRLAEEYGVKIFTADIIYHLFDHYREYIESIKEEKRKEAADEVVFPCRMKIMPNCVFNKKDPIIIGVEVLDGIVKVGTPICIRCQKEFINIGCIASIKNNHIYLDVAKKGQKVAIKIVGSNPEEQQKMFGRHFDMKDKLISHITQRSFDILKEYYKDDLSMEEWRLAEELKIKFKIQ